MLKLLRNMYSNVTITVKTKQGFTNPFECKSGVRQGCLLGLELFSIRANVELSEYRRIHIWETKDVIWVCTDEIVLVGEAIIELQRKINMLRRLYRRYDMQVNLEKSKPMPFRKGGKTAKKGIILPFGAKY